LYGKVKSTGGLDMGCQGSQVSKTNLLWSTPQGDVSVGPVVKKSPSSWLTNFQVGAS